MTTPGPWTLTSGRQLHTPSGVFYLAYNQDKNGNPLFPHFCELDANARLIAKAPEMLNTLEAIRAWLQGDYDHPALMAKQELPIQKYELIIQWIEDVLDKEPTP